MIASVACAAELIQDVKPLPLTPVEQADLENKPGKLRDLPWRFTPYNVQRPRQPKRVEIFGDRKVYWADDPVGQFLVYFIGQDISTPGVKLVLEVRRISKGPDKGIVASREISPVSTPKVSLQINMTDLPIGHYLLRARLVGGSQYRAIPDYEFQKADKRNEKVSIPPQGIPIMVGAQTNLATAVWPITTGIPLPREAANSVDQFVLLEDGNPVPAQFSIRATWHPNRQIKWLGLDFLARYEKGKPRDYRLKVLPEGKTEPAPPSSLRVEESADFITVETGKLRFKVNRKKFTGIEEAWLADKSGKYDQSLVRGEGGPWLVDERGERFEASQDSNASITVEEKGPVRVTIYATGWYVSAKTKEKLCIFKTRISAHNDQPFVNVAHRTIITYDTEKKKLADVAFDVKPVEAVKWQMGADGKVLSGDLPPGNGTVWLHQDRWDHFRVQDQDKPVGEGKQSDGWGVEVMKSGSLSVMLRNIWQLYPKELELSREAVTLHFWPKHGGQAFTEEDELARKNIHKIFYAHQGQLLDLKLPRKYYDAMKKIMPMIERQDENALQANGQGLAIGNEFCLYFNGTQTDGIARQAALYQENPHAIADPAWNAKTEVEGRFAAVDAKRFPTVEKVLKEGYRGSHSSVDLSHAYGMWIWPDTHNNWNPETGLPEWHRFWLNSHYQGVGAAWFLYLRGGDPWVFKWASNNTQHFMNVGTVNYDNPQEPLLGHIAGAMYHTKGFLPWGSPSNGTPKGDDYVEASAHFINPGAFIMSYLIRGDQYGRELMEEWGGRAVNRAALAPERSRETCTTLGEMLTYYTTTWDPQALLYIHDLADDMMSRPVMEVPATSGHVFFHKQWVRRYWELTRDERIIQYVQEWVRAEGRDATGNPELSALLYRWTGDKKHLTDLMPRISTLWQSLYFNSDDPLDGYGIICYDRSYFPQTLPYYLQALSEAGINSLPADEKGAKPTEKAMAIPKKTNFAPAGWGLSQWGGAFGFLMPKGGEPVIQLEVAPTKGQFGYGPALITSTAPFYLRIEDADGKVLLDESCLHGSKRPFASINLDARKQKAPWKFYKNGAGVEMKWDGSADSLYLGSTPAETEKAAETGK
ncbi:MAG: hypothetical protein HY360_10230 [Verrucomicrobia bacterium]|nr:hypothetical protein [Verrucomicrobiota bacterium]